MHESGTFNKGLYNDLKTWFLINIQQILPELMDGCKLTPGKKKHACTPEFGLPQSDI